MRRRGWAAVLALAFACGGSDDDPSGETEANDDAASVGDDTAGMTEGDDARTSARETSEGDDGGGDGGDDDPGEPDLACELAAQNCDAGEKCNPWAGDGSRTWTGAQCFALASDAKGAGEACTAETSGVSGIDDCEAGTMCWGVDRTTLQGECRTLCGASSPPCAGDQQDCVEFFAFGLCAAVQCNPTRDECPEGESCISRPDSSPTSARFACVPPSVSAKNPGDACEFANACRVGSMCLREPGTCDGDVGCCLRVCDPTVADGCAAGETCHPWADAADTEIGVCGVDVPDWAFVIDAIEW